MSDIGAIGVPANILTEIFELTPDDNILVLDAPGGVWSLRRISRDNARTSLGGGGGGGAIDGGNASSNYGGTTPIDGGSA